MKIFIAGGTGYIGNIIINYISNDDYIFTVVGRSRKKNYDTHKNIHFLQCDLTQPGEWQDILINHDIVINLAGRTINTRWTSHIKKSIYEPLNHFLNTNLQFFPCNEIELADHLI